HVDGSIQEVLSFLARLLIAAEEGGRTGSVIEILVLQALAHQVQADIDAALVPLERALTLAEPEGYVRIFVDEGAPMVVLLQEAGKRKITPSYINQLLKAAGATEPAEDQGGEGRKSIGQVLSEPLSERELEVLRLLRTDLNGPEIARELMV